MNLDNARRGSLVAILLIVVGGLLFLDNLGILRMGDMAAYWPAWWIILGAFILDKKRTAVGVIWAVALMATGVLLILGNLRIVQVNAGIISPIILIAFGVTMLVSPTQLGEWSSNWRQAAAARRVNMYGNRRHYGWQGCGQPTGTSYGNRIREDVIFSSVNRRVETQQFEGGKVAAVFGYMQLDLTAAAISSSDGSARLKADAVFGGIEIIVPRTWRVEMRSAAVFGGCDDQTVPPRPEPGFNPMRLIVTGAGVFGGISIRN